MKPAAILLLGLLAIVPMTSVWVRIAPEYAERWHVPPEAPDGGGGAFEGEPNGARAVVDLPVPPEVALTRLDRIARGTARTALLYGDAGSGLMTWRTRSALFGFPDYATAHAMAVPGGSRIVIHSRARFGGSDFGVNARRMRAWLDRLKDA